MKFNKYTQKKLFMLLGAQSLKIEKYEELFSKLEDTLDISLQSLGVDSDLLNSIVTKVNYLSACLSQGQKELNNALEQCQNFKKMLDSDSMGIFPLTIVADRYNGVYSGGKWTAWNADSGDVPRAINGNDSECMKFWFNAANCGVKYGVGNTPQEAIKDLKGKLRRYRVRVI